MITLTKPDIFDLFKAYCKVNNKWGVYVSLPWGGDNDTATKEENHANIDFSLPLWSKYWKSKEEVMIDAIDGYVIFLCNTEEEMNNVYDQVRGDDGLPNDRTPGDCFACTCSPEGILLTENT